VAAK
jgi:hypothetical protein